MDINTQFQSFVQCLDCQAKSRSAQFLAPIDVPYIWILLNWQVVSTAGWIDALCSYVASKHDAKYCALIISSNEDEEHLHQGLRQVAVALGNLPLLEHLEILRYWYEYKAMDNLSHCSCAWGCKGLSWFYTKDLTIVDFRSEAIVLHHVRQITKFQSSSGLGHTLGRTTNPPIVISNVEEFAEALQNCPLLTSFEFYCEPDQRIPHAHAALLSMPKLSKVSTHLSSFTAEMVTEIVAKDTMRELSLSNVDVTTAREWTALCSALGRKSAKLTVLHINCLELPSNGEFYAELSRALLTNESLETLILWSTFSYKHCNILLPSHGAVLAQALANHPRLHELQINIPYGLSPDNHHVWQELFCNGIAQMRSLQRLKLFGFHSWTPSMVEALQRLVPSLSDLTIESINTTKEWFDAVSCVVYGRHLATLSIELKKDVQHKEEKQKYTKLMEGVLAMNQAGRQYILDDSTNKCKTIVVFASVTDNLNCLYIHLRENVLFG